jgi:CRP/FNR family transcriptional regulator, cyclic AMP receptor protein
MALEPDVRAALARSHFAALPDDLLGRLTAGAVRVELPAGTDVILPGGAGRLLLVVAGVTKTYLIAPNGRQATIRYARPGDILAAPTLFDSRPSTAGCRTLVPTVVLFFNMDTARALTASDVRVANVFNIEMAQRLYAYFGELAGTTFGSLRERVARHLLDVASEQRPEPTLIARISQQELADAVGSVREVVARVLARLRDDGLIRNGEAGIELPDPASLAEEAPTGVTSVTRKGTGVTDKPHRPDDSPH